MAQTPGEAYAENNYGDDVPNVTPPAPVDPNRAYAVGLALHALYTAGYKPQAAADIIKALGVTGEDMDAGLETFVRATDALRNRGR